MSSNEDRNLIDTLDIASTDDLTPVNGEPCGNTESDSIDINNNLLCYSDHTPTGASSPSAALRNGSATSPGTTSDHGVVGGAPMLQPRRDHLKWEEYFMSLAFLSAQRSKDPVSQVGAVIVNKRNQIVGIGYNGMPRGCRDNDMPWGKRSGDPTKNKGMYVCHAELNAILNKNSADVSGCAIYVALFPCNECAKLIIQAGINKIVYYSDKQYEKPSTKASKKMLVMTGVEYRPFVVWGRRKLTLDFNAVEAVFPDLYGSGDTPDKSADTGYTSDSPERRPAGGDDTQENRQKPHKQRRTESPRTLDQYITWEEYFMAVAFLSAQRCKDPLSQVGACIVNADKRIVAIGYNGMPCGYPDENMPRQNSPRDTLDIKTYYECHAELTAIMNKNGADVRGCTMHVTRFPCNECAKLISQAGLEKVVYYAKYDSTNDQMKAAKTILLRAKVTITEFSKKFRTLIPIDFESIERQEVEDG